MRRAAMDGERRRVRDGRLALGLLLALSLAANLALSASLSLREGMTVLVPAAAGPGWEIGESWAGRRYLEDMARMAAATLLTLTPENAGHVREAAARMSHPSARGAIGAWVAAEAERMASRDLAAAFYPERIEIEPERLAAEVTGQLATWIGREESARVSRTYRLVFRMDGGRIGLLRFEQRED